MGVLTDFVVADRAEAEAVCRSDCPSRDFDGIGAKGIDTVKLGTLYALLTDSGFDPAFISDELCSGGEDGPWVFEVPDDLVRRLADFSPPQLASVAEDWAATEEFENWSLEEVREVLQDLAELCERAVDEGKQVLMWMCL